jgi:hypothetical protein
MKIFFSIILLTLAMTGFGQREYTYENKGINLFLEGEGSANLDFGVGGPSITVGYQFNPHVFLGGGMSQKFGGSRDVRHTETRPLGWYDATDGTFHNDYYLDEKGNRHKIYDEANSNYISECGYSYDEGNCDGGVYWDFFLDFRYNFLAHSRYTPYINYKSGVFLGEFGASDLEEVVLGCRFGCGEGDFAIVGGAGWTYRRLHRDYNWLNPNQHLFTLSLGVEF